MRLRKIVSLVGAFGSLFFTLKQLLKMLRLLLAGVDPSNADFAKAILLISLAAICIFVYYITDYRQKKQELEKMKNRQQRR